MISGIWTGCVGGVAASGTEVIRWGGVRGDQAGRKCGIGMGGSAELKGRGSMRAEEPRTHRS